VIAALAIAIASAGTANAAAPDAVDVVEQLGQPVASAPFMDTAANHVQLQTLSARGKPVVLTLIYFDCPMLCSLVQQGVTKALNQTGLRLGSEYYGLTVSFNPKDTVPEARLRQGGYLQTLKNAEKAHPTDWPYLTGGERSIRTLAGSLGYRYRWDADSQQFEHPAVSMVLGPDGKISRYLYGVELDPRDLKLAILEAAQGRVGTTLDRVILKCFKYDPLSRKYHFYVMGALRAGSGFFAVALAALLAALWWREARRARPAANAAEGGGPGTGQGSGPGAPQVPSGGKAA
jgi:protein SCO1/2